MCVCVCVCVCVYGPGYAYRMAGVPASEPTPPIDEAVFRRSLDGGVRNVRYLCTSTHIYAYAYISYIYILRGGCSCIRTHASQRGGRLPPLARWRGEQCYRYIDMNISIYLYAYVCVCMYIYICIYIHICIYIYICICL